MAGFTFALALDANEIQDEMHIYYRPLLFVFSVNTVMAVSPSDDSVSSDGSVCAVEECCNLHLYLFQRDTLQDMINGY